MGFFSSKWLVTFEYSEGFFYSYKQSSIVVEANNEYSAKAEAKKVLEKQYKYINIKSIEKADYKGRPIVKPVASPTTTIYSSSAYAENHHSSSTSSSLTPEEREQMRIEREQERKQAAIASKRLEIKKARFAPTRNTILAGSLSLGAFLLSWIPYLIGLARVNFAKHLLDMWIEMGYSKTDSYGQELSSDIVRCSNEANSVLWLPFVVLAIGIAITLLVLFLSRKKAPQKLSRLRKELENLNK